uniref:Uncharacterized protein n=1 Tax=Romanomermis culicivorax TaxID=13658 RepID=A0A915JT64_ROMCU
MNTFLAPHLKAQVAQSKAVSPQPRTTTRPKSRGIGQLFWHGASAHFKQRPASFKAPRSLNVVCLTSSKLSVKVTLLGTTLADVCTLGFNDNKF